MNEDIFIYSIILLVHKLAHAYAQLSWIYMSNIEIETET